MMDHLLTPSSCNLDIFALTAILNTILKTLFHAKSYIVIPTCVQRSVTKTMWNSNTGIQVRLGETISSLVKGLNSLSVIIRIRSGSCLNRSRQVEE